MKPVKRIFLIVLDSLGVGAAPDAVLFEDEGVSTIRSVSRSRHFHIDNLIAMGFGNIPGLSFLGESASPKAAVGRMLERSMGKDTTIGHWELAGLVSEKPLPTYPNGFPEAVLAPFREKTGRGILCNRPYSGTDVIRDYGEEHLRTGDLIVYTSADSVFQIAAHERIVPPEQLYEYCRVARAILQGEHGVGRVIARPFEGETPFRRTANRHDFSLEPPGETVLDALVAHGGEVIAVGKIHDIFAGRGITDVIHTYGNSNGMEVTMDLAARNFFGLCFVNLVDFDMLYGHRQDADGYAIALSEFDAWLPGFLARLGADDLVLLTADHGCDPSDTSTDHTREYVPIIALGARVRPANLGTRESFSDVAASVAELLAVPYETVGRSFAKEVVQ